MDIKEVTLKISDMAREIWTATQHFALRQRYNTNHTDEQRATEKRLFAAEQTAKFFEMKALYVQYRNEIFDYLETIPPHEREELHFKPAMDALEKCIMDDLETKLDL